MARIKRDPNQELIRRSKLGRKYVNTPPPASRQNLAPSDTYDARVLTVFWLLMVFRTLVLVFLVVSQVLGDNGFRLLQTRNGENKPDDFTAKLNGIKHKNEVRHRYVFLGLTTSSSQVFEAIEGHNNLLGFCRVLVRLIEKLEYFHDGVVLIG